MREHIPGYAGYVPGRKSPRVKKHVHRDNQADIPGKFYPFTRS